MISKRAKSISPSVTLSISQKVKELKKSGEDIINLSIGEPDFYTPETALKRGKKAIDEKITKYDAASGNLALKKAILNKLKKDNNLVYEIENIVVSSGAKHAITNSIIATINPLDEVLIPKPYWVSYPEMVRLNGGVVKFVDSKRENNFKLTLEDIKKEVTDKTKMIIFNNPSNPTGTLYNKDELEEICNYLTKKKIIILADEIYERIVYDETFTSVAELSDEIKNNTILINGVSKSLAMTGLRIGYSVANKEISNAISKVQSHLVSHPATISQEIAIEALNECDMDIKKMVIEYKSRRDEIIKELDEFKLLPYIEPKGAFYIFIDMSILKEKIKEDLSLTVCNEMLSRKKVALVPGKAFGEDDFIRLSYAQDINDILAGLKRLKEYVVEKLDESN